MVRAQDYTGVTWSTGGHHGSSTSAAECLVVGHASRRRRTRGWRRWRHRRRVRPRRSFSSLPATTSSPRGRGTGLRQATPSAVSAAATFLYYRSGVSLPRLPPPSPPPAPLPFATGGEADLYLRGGVSICTAGVQIRSRSARLGPDLGCPERPLNDDEGASERPLCAVAERDLNGLDAVGAAAVPAELRAAVARLLGPASAYLGSTAAPASGARLNLSRPLNASSFIFRLAASDRVVDAFAGTAVTWEHVVAPRQGQGFSWRPLPARRGPVRSLCSPQRRRRREQQQMSARRP